MIREMIKISDDELQKEIKKQEKDFGDFDDIDPDELGKDTEADLERVIGNDVDPEEDGFSIAEEVDKDEDAIEEGSDQEGDEEELMSIEDMAEEEDAFNDEDL